jgi:hypothetical protein
MVVHRLGFALIAIGLLSGCQTGHLAPIDPVAATADMTARERAEADLNRQYYGAVPVTANGCPPRSSVMYGGKSYCVGTHN